MSEKGGRSQASVFLQTKGESSLRVRTACDTWATGLSGSRCSHGDNGSFCPAHKFSGKERVPGPASPCLHNAGGPGPHWEGCHSIWGAFRPLHLSVPSPRAGAGDGASCQTFCRGWGSGPKHCLSQELGCTASSRKPKDPEAPNESLSICAVTA